MAALGVGQTAHARWERVFPGSVPRVPTESYGKYEKNWRSTDQRDAGAWPTTSRRPIAQYLIPPTLQPHARLLHGAFPPVTERITVAERVAVQAREELLGPELDERVAVRWSKGPVGIALQRRPVDPPMLTIVRKDELQRVDDRVRKGRLVAVADDDAVDRPGTDLVQHQVALLKRCAQVVESSAAIGGTAREWQSASSRQKC